MTPGEDAAKRVVDVLGAAGVLLVTAPLALLTATVVWLDLGSPVLFRQVRPGRAGEPFELVKFRTMRPPAPGVDDDAQRLTPLGRLLRATSLDEIPTLWNVLRGEMSLVGPRPLLVSYLGLYTAEQARRHEVRPGVTGLAQVEGRNEVDWEQRLALDVHYVQNRSLGLDLRILAGTVPVVLRGRGVCAPGRATMSAFGGSP